MFILTNVSIEKNLAQVFDTKDGSNDLVRLNILADQVNNGKLKVYGVGRLVSMKRQDSVPIDKYNIYINMQEAKEALATQYMDRGMSKEQARKKVGIV